LSPVAGRITERELQSSLRRAAREFGWLEHVAWSSLHSPKGWPDLTLAKGTTLLVWELKNDRAAPSPEQRRWLDWWTRFADAAGGVEISVALVRPGDLERAYNALMGRRDAYWPAQWIPGQPSIDLSHRQVAG
jgi:hypothetical protein